MLLVFAPLALLAAAPGRQVIDLAGTPCRAQLAGGGVYPAPPPKPLCTFHADMQLSDPGSKHTMPPMPAANQGACCVECMKRASCFGAELYGGSCYLKTAKLPLVRQNPPKGVALVACVKNQTLSGEERPVFFARVPGDIIAALERADQLGINNQSIYFSTNLKSAAVQAAQNASYWLNCSVAAEATFLARTRHTLLIDGLDYNASVFLNGHPIGAHAGPYLIGQLPIQSGLLHASNELSLLFHMPPQKLIGGWLAPGNAVQGVMWEYLDYWKSMVGIGYDFGQPFWGIGIQEGAWLVASDHCLISDLAVLPVSAAHCHLFQSCPFVPPRRRHTAMVQIQGHEEVAHTNWDFGPLLPHSLGAYTAAACIAMHRCSAATTVLQPSTPASASPVSTQPPPSLQRGVCTALQVTDSRPTPTS